MKVAVLMGSTSDWKVMSGAVDILETLGIEYEKRVISAHRTPDLMYEFAHSAKANGFNVIIAGAGGAAHVPGMIAAMTTIPVIGVPLTSMGLGGLDALMSIVQMPSGFPVATVALDGAKNAAFLAASILSLQDEALASRIEEYRRQQAEKVKQAQL